MGLGQGRGQGLHPLHPAGSEGQVAPLGRQEAGGGFPEPR